MEGLQVKLAIGYKRPNRHILLNVLVIYIKVTRKTYSNKKYLNTHIFCRHKQLKQNERRKK